MSRCITRLAGSVEKIEKNWVMSSRTSGRKLISRGNTILKNAYIKGNNNDHSSSR